jgi:hypothetical protein
VDASQSCVLPMRWTLSDLKIGTRLAIAFALVLALAAVMTGLGVWRLHHMQGAIPITLKEAPKLTIDSGDTVSIETMMHSHDKVSDGVTMQELIALGKAKAMVIALAQALGKLIPADKPYFDANRDMFIKQVDARMAVWTKALAPYAGTRIVVVHDTWTYFADRFNLSIVAAAEATPGVPPSPAELARLYARMREAQVRLVAADPNSNESLVRQIAEHGNARMWHWCLRSARIGMHATISR